MLTNDKFHTIIPVVCCETYWYGGEYTFVFPIQIPPSVARAAAFKRLDEIDQDKKQIRKSY